MARPEISFEIKGLTYKRKINTFALEGTASNFTLVAKEFKNSVVSPSFASVVYPFKNLTVSAFRHELVNFESAFYTRGVFIPEPQESFLYPV